MSPLPPRRPLNRWTPAGQPTTAPTTRQLRVAQRYRVTELYSKINTALAEERAKGHHRTVNHLLKALRSVDSALDILGEQTSTTNGRGRHGR